MLFWERDIILKTLLPSVAVPPRRCFGPSIGGVSLVGTSFLFAHEELLSMDLFKKLAVAT